MAFPPFRCCFLLAVRVGVRHWGCAFTEPVWAAVLDVCAALPIEVVFGDCGVHTGSLRLHEVCLKLVRTQEILACGRNTVRVRSKMAGLMATFRSSCPDAYKTWMGSYVKGVERWGTVKTLGNKCLLNMDDPASSCTS